MPIVTLVVKVVAKPASVEKAKAEMLKLVGPTRQEPGCIEYRLHQDKGDRAQFVFYERWESPERLQAHMRSEHFRRFQAAAADCVETVDARELDGLEDD